MKVSLAITVLILAAAILINGHLESRLAVARKKQTAMAVLKDRGGPLANGPAHSSLPDPDGGLGSREEAVAREAAVKLFAFAREMEPFEDGPADQAALSDPVLRSRWVEHMELLTSLNAVHLRVLISETLANRELREKTRQGMLATFVTALGKLNPQEALTVFTSAPEHFKKESKPAEIIAAVLGDLAEKDPAAAAAWVGANREKFPDYITWRTQESILKAAAAKDPAMAFELMGDLGIGDAEKAASVIAGTAATGGNRDAALEAVRRFVQGLSDESAGRRASESAIRLLAAGVAREGFEAASQWPAAVKLSPAELDSFVRGLNPSAKSGSIGQWMEWLGRTLPADRLEGAVHERILHWTAQDHKAVGNWLNTCPGGPGGAAAVSAFAEAVAPYEPDSAEQWALTLPEGKRRDDLRRRITEWRISKAAATEAASHGQPGPSKEN